MSPLPLRMTGEQCWQPGGLPEFEFYMGTQPGTVSSPVRIP